MTALDNDSLRVLERTSITRFVQANEKLLRGARVLDLGCGKQPYRGIIEAAGGQYSGYDRADLPANVSEEDIGLSLQEMLAQEWDVILVTQVIQYIAPWLVSEWLGHIRSALFARRGTFLMTGPTTWPLVEPEDVCRYTPNGMRLILEACGFTEVHVGIRASISAGSVGLAIGWQAQAKAA